MFLNSLSTETVRQYFHSANTCKQPSKAVPAIDPQLMDYNINTPTDAFTTPSLPQTPPIAPMAQADAHQQDLAEQLELALQNDALNQSLESHSTQVQHQHPTPAAYMQPLQDTFVSPVPAQHSLEPAGFEANPTTASTPASTLIPKSDSPFFGAVSIANKSGTPEVKSALAHLYTATQQDPELEQLLQEAATSDAAGSSVADNASALGRKIKQVKKSFRSQTNSPGVTREASLQGANSSRQASSHLISPPAGLQASMAADALNNISPYPTEFPSILPLATYSNNELDFDDSAPHAKRTKLSSDLDALRAISTEPGSAGPPRSFTSPLSSVNENIIMTNDDHIRTEDDL